MRAGIREPVRISTSSTGATNAERDAQRRSLCDRFLLSSVAGSEGGTYARGAGALTGVDCPEVKSHGHAVTALPPLHAHHFADLFQVGHTCHRIVRRGHAKTHALVIAVQRGEEIDGFARSVQRRAHFFKVAVIKIRAA